MLAIPFLKVLLILILTTEPNLGIKYFFNKILQVGKPIFFLFENL